MVDNGLTEKLLTSFVASISIVISSHPQPTVTAEPIVKEIWRFEDLAKSGSESAHTLEKSSRELIFTRLTPHS